MVARMHDVCEDRGMTTTAAQVAALAATIRPYLPAAIQRFGSLGSAVDHLVALMAADAFEAAESVTAEIRPARGARFVHARQLDTTWTPGPGERYADAPKAVMVVTRVASGRVWYGVDEPDPRGSFVADANRLDEVVGRWIV